RTSATRSSRRASRSSTGGVSISTPMSCDSSGWLSWSTRCWVYAAASSVLPDERLAHHVRSGGDDQQPVDALRHPVGVQLRAAPGDQLVHPFAEQDDPLRRAGGTAA